MNFFVLFVPSFFGTLLRYLEVARVSFGLEFGSVNGIRVWSFGTFVGSTYLFGSLQIHTLSRSLDSSFSVRNDQICFIMVNFRGSHE